MKLWQNFKKIWIICLTGGCVAYTPPSNYVYEEISTPQFQLASWQKIEKPGAPLTVYIEGDGYAFNYEGRASRNPTPRTTTMRDLAFRDQDANVAYLARPCQYVSDEKCHKKFWTTGRFALEVIAAEAEAVRHLQKKSGSKEVILVGYSGGAMVAGLIAVQNTDIKVKKLITIAGLLEHRRWAQYHQVAPLDDSLDLGDYSSELAKIPQVHFLGEQDKIIPVKLSPVKEQAIVVSGANHGSGWDKLDLSEYK